MRKSNRFFSWVATSLFTFALAVGIVTAIGTNAVVSTSATSAKTAVVATPATPATPATSPSTSTLSTLSSTHPTTFTRTYVDDGSTNRGDN